tara:strand:+ start:5026 stop:5541 length:516 start_codon:yes stop_codon:yes gene_type:complete
MPVYPPPTTVVMINRSFEIMENDKATLPFWEFLQYLHTQVATLEAIHNNNGDVMGEIVVVADGVRPTTVANTVLYTSPSLGNGTKISRLLAANTLASVETFDLYVVPEGQAVAPNYLIIAGADASGNGSLVANGTNELNEAETVLIPSGGTLVVAVTNANSITFRGSGIAY